MTTMPDEAPFWVKGTDETFRALDCGAAGLTSVQAAERLDRYGLNVAKVQRRVGLLGKIGKRLADPLVAILLVAAGVLGVTGDWQSFAIIAVVVTLSVVLDIVQETKAENAIEALNRSVAITSAVRRDGRLSELPSREIVPGDVVELKSGDLVPADGIVLSSHGALVNEALLTGEPYPVEKRPGPCTGAAPHEAFNALFGGTSLVSGEAEMLVVATAAATRFGAIAGLVQENEGPTAFERGVHSLGMLILRLTGFLVLFVLLTQSLRQGFSIETFLFAVALAVGLTPELLPMVVTVTLSRGAVRMAKRDVVVKRLSAIQDLGAMDVLCTDKTGTLTEAKIAHVASIGVDGAESARVTDLVRLNSAFARGVRSNLDDAIRAAASPPEGWTLVGDVPFDFDRRRSSVAVAHGGTTTLIAKGAPEMLLAVCDRVEAADGSVRPLDAAARQAISAILDEKGAQGFRLLGVGWRDLATGAEKLAPSDETGLVFAGCAVFLDPPKADARAAVDRLLKAGVHIKIISGDAVPVVQHLAQALGLPAKRALTGEQIAALSDVALANRIRRVDIFGRIAPDQKSRIVHALQRRGHTVGFIGDGINDAPAIHAADVGLSVSGGSDVARGAADIILLAQDLGVLADGVEEGRRTYANIMKYVRMATSSNFGNMLSTALASLLLPFLPLTPIQILLNNLLYDLSEIGIPFDSADKGDTDQPRTWDIGSVLRFTLVMGPLSSLFDLLTFALLRLWFEAGAEVFRTAWFVESIATQILVIFVIRTRLPAWSSRPAPVLVLTSLAGLACALALALSPVGALLGFAPLSAEILLAVAGICLAYLLSAEALKRFAVKDTRSKAGSLLHQLVWQPTARKIRSVSKR